ncbi:conserved hypothetical protein [Alkaliphilus metalliredigens QYMF]|uniref:Copper transporter n=1 Tax=Alkaliphilus metalliredigens (strain QYMF) TaxID=293826 RepID=A6TR52_ALKMQ|nr:copper transporter [Alkaliphilus metalliredigens]ABR48670.1 conserved hypothetical protein [Alkaliphilus metalliredigens QYMF]
MLNIKYFVISIAAIFIALGIGMFIGFNMNGQEIYFKHQEALIDSLENRFSEFKIEKELLEQNIQQITIENNKKDNFIEKVYLEVISERLLGINVGIIQTTDQFYYNNIRETLENAGALIPMEIVYTDKLFNVSESYIDEINLVYQLDLVGRSDWLSYVNHQITGYVKSGEASHFIVELVDNQLIQVVTYYDDLTVYPINQVVLAGGHISEDKNKPNMIDIDLINRFRENNLPTIAVERLDVGYSYISYYKQATVSTIDNVNTKIGEISLVLVLNGADGNFGEKPTADELVPSVTNIEE